MQGSRSINTKKEAILLIHPPVAKPCEPPPGIARLAGALDGCNIDCIMVDANLEGLLSLMSKPRDFSDRWTHRAFRNLSNHLDAMRSRRGYESPDRYRRAVADLNRLLETSTASGPDRVSLSNCTHPSLSPVRSRDLLRAAEFPEMSPFYPYFSQRLPGLIEKQRPAAVGFSLNFLSQALCTFAMMGFLRRELPELRLILGGGLVTSWLRRPGWKDPFGGLVDFMVDGAGEGPLLSILGVEHPPGELPVPSYGSLPLAQYLSPALVLPYSASSGCFWSRCAFCPERAEGSPYSPIPPNRVVEDLLFLSEGLRPGLIHLLDNAVSPALMAAIVQRPPGPSWYGFARVDRGLADPDYCAALRNSGCVMLKLGIESGDQSVLDREQKGIDLEVASRALKTLKEAGIATYVYLLFGTPSETEEGARKTLDFTVRHSHEIDFLNLAIFNLPAYGPESRVLETERLYEGDLSLYTGFRHPRGWDRKSVRQFLDKEFTRHPAVARIVRSDPPFFTSNHAPFFSKAWDGIVAAKR